MTIAIATTTITTDVPIQISLIPFLLRGLPNSSAPDSFVLDTLNPRAGPIQLSLHLLVAPVHVIHAIHHH